MNFRGKPSAGRFTIGGLVKSLESEMSESSPVKLAEGELRFWFC
ncbi:MAG: hypothetical protein ACTS44_00385 [Candidatus Hodgkinia cicadicola]